MSLKNLDINAKLIKEITIILIIKIVLLLTIKHIWFDAPTIPKNFDNQVAEHIAGDNISNIKETR
ncbi:cytochrome oxidase putative small subunit CydP [Acinetobacter calcoaceticus]|uniref:cytochrome oxidase putative small subunit CydP n=1 Tax=Acinetobacter calcoaceticus TaxID=471 RepID=UPI0032B33175